MRHLAPMCVLSLSLLLALAGCQSGGEGGTASTAEADRPAAAAADTAAMGDARRVDVGSLSVQDRREFQIAWNHFLTRSAVWPLYRDEWLKKGGAAPYVLSEALFTHYFRAVLSNRRGELPRVAEAAKEIGEPAVAYFAKALVTDSWPLKQPITTEVMDPDDLNARKKKTFHQFVMDDETRRWTAGILAEIGPPAVPTLSSPAVLRRAHRTSRRYAAYALGRIRSPEAIDALVLMLQTSTDWQDRAAAATALGQAVDTDPRAREVLLQAAETDTDRFVRKKANRALAAADEITFW